MSLFNNTKRTCISKQLISKKRIKNYMLWTEKLPTEYSAIFVMLHGFIE